MSLAPCDKHELSNCGVCSGADKAYRATLEDSHVDRSGPPPRIPGGPTIWSQYAGACTNCGRRYQQGDPIHLNRDIADGWIGVECCLGMGS